MNLNGHVLCSAARTDKLCTILPDDEICRIVEREIGSMEYPLKSMLLTWEKGQREYLLEIVLTEKGAEKLSMPRTRRVTVGSISEQEQDALRQIFIEGRRLYFQLRKDFPMLRCRLTIYKFPRDQAKRYL